VNARQKQAVIDRAQECCEYCQSQARFATHPFSIEHIYPRIRITPIGRTTVDALKLNREGLVNLRQILFSVGAHPQVTSEF
jgi:hypothetical protein